MTEPSMVCNGHKENNIEKCPVNTVNELFPFEKSNSESTNIEENSSKDSMTIGTIPFPDFDHLYASSVEETGEPNSLNMNIARSNLNCYHLNIIEEQAKIIDTQNKEIVKLKKQNESLIARIERMNRRLNLNQCIRRGNSRRGKRLSRGNKNIDFLEENKNLTICNSSEDEEKKLGETFPEDVPLINFIPSGDQLDSIKGSSVSENSILGDTPQIITNDSRQSNSAKMESDTQISKNQNFISNFRIKFRRNITFNNQRQKRGKVVRFVEEKNENCLGKPKRNFAKTIDDKLIADDAVLFLKSLPDKQTEKKSLDEIIQETEAEEIVSIRKKKSFKIPILTTVESYFTSVKEDTCHVYDPITYTPTALEVPSFRMIEKDNVETPDVPKDYYEDVTIEAAKERHLRFEVGERKRKKWDVQRIRELRQNERLKEKLRKRKNRFNKVEPIKLQTSDTSETITTLFPDIRSIEKIIITDAVPVTALGISIPKIPTWGSDFRTEWVNDGTVDPIFYDDNQHLHHRETRSKPA